MLFSICLLLVTVGTWAFVSEYGVAGFNMREYRRMVAVFFIPLLIKIGRSLIFPKKDEKKILQVFSTLLNRHRIIEIEYPDISNEKIQGIIDDYNSFYPSRTKIIPIEEGYLVLGKMNLWKKILGENDDFYVEQIPSGFSVYLNTIGGRSPVYEFLEHHFGIG